MKSHRLPVTLIISFTEEKSPDLFTTASLFRTFLVQMLEVAQEYTWPCSSP